MKRFKYIFRAILLALLINLTTQAKAQETEESWLDSVDISLLTCGPGQEVWSYYGHTALRIEDKAHGNDLAVNWGMFSFKQGYFILRFVFGLTDYQIGVFPMSEFINEYTYEGRWVLQQRLVLTRNEKLQIVRAIEENNQEANRTYRYNFFYDNCTTRARDMITSHLQSAIPENCEENDDYPQSTYRHEIHRWNGEHRWARMGNDLLLGYKADRPLSKKEWEFLPINLSKDFAIKARKDTAKQKSAIGGIYQPKAHTISLVDTTFYVVAPQTTITESEAFTPFIAAICIAVLVVLACIWEFIRKKTFWWVDALLLTITGIPGLILLAMVFSAHPTVQINFQILILNPLNLVFVWPLAKKFKNGGFHWYYNVWGGLVIMALFLQIWQEYAEGMVVLALTLLVRYLFRSITFDLKNILRKKK